jgi:hypothetical protein
MAHLLAFRSRVFDAQGVGSDLPDLFRETSHHLGESGRFGGAHPFQGEPFGIDSEAVEDQADGLKACGCLMITVQVMAFTRVSAHDQNAVRALEEGMHDEVRAHHPRAHHADGPHVGGVLKARNPGEITAGVSAPVAQKPDDDGFEWSFHVALLSDS